MKQGWDSGRQVLYKKSESLARGCSIQLAHIMVSWCVACKEVGNKDMGTPGLQAGPDSLSHKIEHHGMVRQTVVL